MRKRLGRNDPCWCGSHKKFKKCHLAREKQQPIEWWDAAHEFRKAFSTKDCLAPEPLKDNCSPTTVRAHTVPKSGSLNKIARDGPYHESSTWDSEARPLSYESDGQLKETEDQEHRADTIAVAGDGSIDLRQLWTYDCYP